MLPIFKKAIEEFQVPSRVRADGGGENVLIAKLMMVVEKMFFVVHIEVLSLLDNQSTILELNDYGVILLVIHLDCTLICFLNIQRKDLMSIIAFTYMFYNICLFLKLMKHC